MSDEHDQTDGERDRDEAPYELNRQAVGRVIYAVDTGNRVLPPTDSVPERPLADPPSIYEWQKRSSI